MAIQNIYFVPHPPIIMKEIGGRDVDHAKDTVIAYHKIAKMIAEDRPKTIIFVSPHGLSFDNGTCFYDETYLRGDFEMFGSPEITFHKSIDQEMTKCLESLMEQNDFTSILMTNELVKNYNRSLKLDHGVMVPMYFIDQYYIDYEVVHLTPGGTSLLENYKIGMLVRKITDQFDDCVIVCSGDLSHALKSSGPYAFHKDGPVFDQVMRDSVEKQDVEMLLTLEDSFVENAAQCGLRSFLIGFGALDGYTYKSSLYSYEGPFGVGYMIASLMPVEKTDSFYKTFEGKRDQLFEQRLSEESLYVTLARLTIAHYLKSRRTLKREMFKEIVLSSEFYHYSAEEVELFLEALSHERKGSFVSIHKNHHLRGCMGTIEPALNDLYDEIAYNAIIASTEDPRFNEINPCELKDLEISVDVLMAKEAVEDLDAFDVNRYGMIVEKGRKRGLLLPNLDSVTTVKEQYRICLDKAGIYMDQGVKLYRFEVIRHK
ncbi:AmmeMemoRadiSam system protein A [Fusibacter ferrireducens]|uniref:AmmeMemoRadiSam system protein A n=1 Tax=Fusibacter ferrireducens TaxID=2785058 RepID=A0ABR9ZWK7_9FIRM|nr:AmmeMemoRadiSam system protein A [Fusibacter ferrireducens]MBF4694826.1 AmmeMemoRadiSam system protein A [Fusibacter ferrireducens]